MRAAIGSEAASRALLESKFIADWFLETFWVFATSHD
jgi:hypothetical protein